MLARPVEGARDEALCNEVEARRAAEAALEVGLYTILPPPIVYGVWHEKGGSVGGRILRDGHAIVLR